MTESEAVEIIHQELVETNSIPVKLSLKKGIDERAVARLIEAMEYLRFLYKSRKEVHKKVAAAFVDLRPAFERCLGLYTQQEQDRIIDLEDRIISLALDMFEAEPPHIVQKEK